MSRECGRVRVYVTDDHPLYRDALTRAIKSRPEFELVGESSEGRAGLEEIKRLEPDVALLDMRMPGLDGVSVLRAIKRDGAPTRVVVVSAHEDSESVYRALAAGADAFVSKSADREEICDTVAAVSRGKTRLSPDMQARLLQELHNRSADDRPGLTPREREILILTADGHSAPDIGARLHLSTATIKSHLQHLYEKLGVSDRAAAVAEAMRRGLME
jgi:two-component system, NarL family, nitrate/nitrite response regulator NarL